MEGNNKILCEICCSLATSLCLDCFQYFCDSCYKLVHAIKEKAEHKKNEIHNRFPIETKCKNHPKYLNELFCIDERGK